MKRNKRQNIIIINKEQFGILTDSYKWCQYLREYYDITFICFDLGSEKMYLDGVEVVYVSPRGSKYIRALRFLLVCCWQIFKIRSKVIVVYFEKCHVLKRIFPKRWMNMDIRTLAVMGSDAHRMQYDNEIKYSASYFDSVTVISEPIYLKLGLKNKLVNILPLGADVISSAHKRFDFIRLLYVGTLSGRDINKTVSGLHKFLCKNPGVNISYDIVGDGMEYGSLTKLINELGLQRYVTLHGRVPSDQLTPFFNKCNVGVSFVPMTDYYDNQPSTKVYEYALSGLYQIATSTSANRKLLNEHMGILIIDTADAFADALEKVHLNLPNINEDIVRASCRESEWKTIVINHLKPILE